jgi:imipenem/basic amino acid-specific outer membrane pore
MRGTVSLSLLASALVVNAMAADDLAGMFKEGKVSGQIRAFYIDRDYSGTPSIHRNGFTLGGNLKFETGSFEGLSAGAAFYTANRIFRGIEKDTYDPSIIGANGGSYSILGEAYLQYKNGNTTFKGGRQKLDTPLAGADDARALPSLFEAYVLSNTDIKDTTLIAAHVTKFAPGTFAIGYDAGNVLGMTSGYSGVAGNGTKYSGEFVNMGDWAIGKSNNGVSAAAAIYSGIPGLKLQLWDYYAHDILNAVYAEGNYGIAFGAIAPYIGVQYIKEDNIGSDYAGDVNSDFIAAKVGVKVANFDIYGAVSQNSKDAASAANGGTISPWGGMPAYTQGMVTRHQFMAGTDAFKVAGSYDWKDFGLNLNTGVYYTSFKMDELNGYSANHSWTATEGGFDFIYSPEVVKNLQLRLRGNFPRDYKETATTHTEWNEYRFIANYNF